MSEEINRTAPQVIYKFDCEFVEHQNQEREYNQFLYRKIEISRISMREGVGHSNDEIEAEFAARRAKLTKHK
jgi:hypothetical protein